MVSRLGVDELHVHPEAVATTLHRAFEHIADVQLTSELLYVNALSLEGERSVTCNHERAIDARQVRGEALGHPIHEVLLLGIAAEVGEGQYNDGKMRRRNRRRRRLAAARPRANRLNCDGLGFLHPTD